MIINRILNNNVVVTINEFGKEQIVMGRGLAYKRKCGDHVDDTLIDKIYTLSNPDLSSKFQELLAEIPHEHIELCDEIIAYAKTYLGKKLNDTIYISLADHIYSATQRVSDGIVVKNALLWDIRRFYKDEYRIGQTALQMVLDKFQIQLPDDEAGFIALHIVNAELDNENLNDMYEITKVMQEVANIVKYYFNMEFNEDSVYYYRFITHLKFFAQRLMSDNIYRDDSDDDLLEVIRVKYKNAFHCVTTIARFIEQKYEYTLSNEEVLYLTIHIARIIYKNQP